MRGRYSNKCALKGPAECSVQYIILLYLKDCHLRAPADKKGGNSNSIPLEIRGQ